MLDWTWPANGEAAPPVSMDELRLATASADVTGIMAALEGHDVSEVLQFAGSAVQMALGKDPDRVGSLAISLMQRLQDRGLPGDDELAKDLLAELRGEAPQGHRLPVDLEELAGLIEGDPLNDRGGFLDRRTGEMIPAFLIDEVTLRQLLIRTCESSLSVPSRARVPIAASRT